MADPRFTLKGSQYYFLPIFGERLKEWILEYVDWFSYLDFPWMFHWIQWIQWPKNLWLKELLNSNLQPVRNQDANTVPGRPRTDRIFQLTQIHLSDFLNSLSFLSIWRKTPLFLVIQSTKCSLDFSEVALGGQDINVHVTIENGSCDQLIVTWKLTGKLSVVSILVSATNIHWV